LIELLRQGAAVHPDLPAVASSGRIDTYGSLLARAEAIAGALVAQRIARFGLALDHPADVVAVLAGASLAGSEACQYPPVEDAEVIGSLADRLDHQVLLTDRPGLGGSAGAVDLDGLLRGATTAAPAEPPGERPLLVLTTGSTGQPKAARHDWWRVLRAASRIAPDEGRRWLLAYGLHQFAGLQILVHALASRGTLVAPDGLQPVHGLRAIRELAVTAVSATPTWWRFFLTELRSTGGGAPRIEQITLGGEAAPADLLELLAETFPEARISHVYAATEVGSTGSARDGRAGLPLSVLERDDHADVAMRVVDGELWVRSRVGMLGYYGEPPVDPDAWRPTGDLVEIVGDRLLFRGRMSEIINVGGVKVAPLPIEEVVERVPGVEVARVFGRPNRMTGAIVAVEVVVAAGADPEAVIDAVRDACQDLPAAARPRSVRAVEEIAVIGGKRNRKADP
jgi:acyl-CoA synthetase (AMP-forming)/AMP-acid ligase II